MEYNNKCTIMKTGKTELNPIGNPSMSSFFNHAKNKELDKVIESSLINKHEEDYQKELKRKVNLNRYLKSDKMKIFEATYKLGLESIFAHILFETFYNSLYFDEEFKYSKAEELYNIMESYISSKGGYKYLTNNMKGSLFLENVNEVCTSHAKKIAKNTVDKINEKTDEKVTIDFLMTDEEKKDLDKDVQNLNIDQLSKLVKDKVLNVLQDEKERVEKEEEFKEEIDTINNGEEIEKVKEQMRGNIVKEHTLWNSLMQESYKELLKENLNQETKTLTEGFSVDASSIDTFDDIEETYPNNTEIDMDNVMAEALTKYTLMELMYTIKLENYSRNDIKNICTKLNRA